MSFEVTVTPTVYDVEVAVNPSVQPFDVEVTVGNVPDLDLTTNGDSGASTFDPLTGELNIPEYTLDGLGGVPESRTITINGTTQDLSANRTFTIPAPDPVTIGSPANGLAIDGNQVLTIGLASVSQAGALSSTDWSTFNNKQNALGYTAEDVANKSTDTGLGTSNSLYPSQGAVKSYVDTGLSGKENALGFTPENVANKAINLTSPDDTKYPTTLAVSTALAGKQDTLTNPVTGTGVAGQVSFWNGTSTQSGDSGLTWDNVNNRLGLGGITPMYTLQISGNFFTRTGSNPALEYNNGIIYHGTSYYQFFSGLKYLLQARSGYGLSLASNNSEVITINTALNTGILTTTPTNTLDVNGTGRIRNGVSLADISGNVQIGTLTDAGFKLDVNGTARVQGALSVTTGGINLTGAQTISTSTGNLTLASDGGNGNILLTPNGTGNVRVKTNTTGTSTSTLRIDNGGTAGNEVSLEFFSSATDSTISNRSGRIKSYFTTESFSSTYLTFQSVTTGNTLIDTLSLTNGNVLIATTINAGFKLDVNGTARVQGAITTGAPTGGTAKPFKIGAVATVTPTSPNRTIEIEIDGTTYYLTAKTTND